MQWIEIPDQTSEILSLMQWEKQIFGSGGMDFWALRPMAKTQKVLKFLDQGVLIGYAILWNTFENRQAYLFSFAILPEFQGKGLGKSAFFLLLNYLQDFGFSTLKLTVSPKNVQALSIYRACKVLEEIFHSNYYDKGEDRLEMLLEISLD